MNTETALLKAIQVDPLNAQPAQAKLTEGIGSADLSALAQGLKDYVDHPERLSDVLWNRTGSGVPS